jgi:hypothetical protein
MPGCNTLGDQKDYCRVPQGGTFAAYVSLEAIPGPYDMMAVTIAYSGADFKNAQDVIWPDCVLEANGSTPPIVNFGCAVGVGQPSSTFTGTVLAATFTCTADGTLSLVHGPADTILIDENGKTSTEEGPDVLNIDCGATTTPLPTGYITPIPTPTLGPVGGVSFEEGNPASTTIAPIAALASLVVVVGVHGVWRAKSRRAPV